MSAPPRLPVTVTVSSIHCICKTQFRRVRNTHSRRARAMSSNPLRGVRVLISGAGVAGPALAYWLSGYGAQVTVVEAAPALRTSGFAVDFRGPTHLGVLAKMGVLDELRRIQTHGGAMSGVAEDGR